MPLGVTGLRALVAVSRAGSITAAAERLSFTPSALSQQLSRLEQEAGCRLLVRTATGVRPTEAGAVLLEHAERVLGELRDAEEAVRAVAGEQPQHLSVGTFATAGKTLLPETLAAFRRVNPQVRLSLLDLEPPRGYDLVTSRDLDLLVTHCYPGISLPVAPGLCRERLLTDPLLVVLPPEHRLAGRPALRFADLGQEEWISGGPGVHNRVCLEAAAARAGIEVRPSYETHDYEVTLALVAAGIGIALVPRTALQHTASPGFVARPLSDVCLARDIFVVHRRRPPRLAADLLAILHRFAGELAGDSTDLSRPMPESGRPDEAVAAGRGSS
ncbi:DNA-binding transcriptional regulator, LysR family [Thermomonospora echinospora]|uniref:DNA-binding transcriptional regulator, LysR family n=1 Tax=Thermomonospora echinospora TaxID=1992 RepID=A0A1H5XV86_9ACTN|nr:LysR family transcriptional regulator [Thermomonospora echinospora]SEG15572.1 DNA-binding transcriptional regulator, LysR family [Thermomonospora echinospora]